jgi:uncharacterized Zn finger protein (UPF0148 family)
MSSEHGEECLNCGAPLYRETPGFCGGCKEFFPNAQTGWPDDSEQRQAEYQHKRNAALTPSQHEQQQFRDGMILLGYIEPRETE